MARLDRKDLTMTKLELEEKLNKICGDFSIEMGQKYMDDCNDVATQGDIAYISRQTFYALSDFKDSILEYLD